MFQNSRRGNTGLASIIAVALVLLAWVASAGVLVKVYREGASSPTAAACEVVCRQAGAVGVKG